MYLAALQMRDCADPGLCRFAKRADLGVDPQTKSSGLQSSIATRRATSSVPCTPVPGTQVSGHSSFELSKLQGRVCLVSSGGFVSELSSVNIMPTRFVRVLQV